MATVGKSGRRLTVACLFFLPNPLLGPSVRLANLVVDNVVNGFFAHGSEPRLSGIEDLKIVLDLE